MSVWKYAVGITLIVYPTLRLVGDVGLVEAGVATVCIALGVFILAETIIEAAVRRGRQTWKR